MHTLLGGATFKLHDASIMLLPEAGERSWIRRPAFMCYKLTGSMMSSRTGSGQTAFSVIVANS